MPIKAVRAFPNLRPKLPVVFTHAGDGTNRIFICNQDGIIYVLPNDQKVSKVKTFLDIDKKVVFKPRQNEEGLLGLAFHPKYRENGEFFVYYTTTDAKNTSVISRVRRSKNDPDKADPNSEEELMRIKQPYWNHNGGRNMVFAVLATVGAVALVAGMLDLSLVRRDKPNQSGLPVLVAGLAGAVGGLIYLASSDSTSANWIGAVLIGAGALVGAVGYARWRHEPAATASGDGMSFGGDVGRRVLIGIGLIALGALFGVLLDSESQTVIGFLLTLQGLRAILFVGLVIAGGILLMGAIGRAKGSATTQLAIGLVTAVSIVGVAFVVQAEGSGRKTRAELFAAILLVALTMAIVAVVRHQFTVRRFEDAVSDRAGRTLAIAGLALMTAAVTIRLLWSTSEENEASAAIISYRIAVFYFVAFAIFASWLLLKTKFGSWTFAVGGNAAASRQVGVPTARTKTQLFMLVSVSAWLVGTLIAFRLNSVQANVGDGQEFFYIIAAVVGGCLLTGGYGSAAGAGIGAVIMAMSFQGIPFSGWNSDWRFLFVGVILLLAVLVNNYVRARAEASR